MKAAHPKKSAQRQSSQQKRKSVDVDIESLLSIENNCDGCAKGEKCCCASFEVCITTAEMKRIIKYLPEAARYCKHLLTPDGYDNIFQKEEPGLYSIDATEEGLCLLAYKSGRATYCSLHTVALKLGLPLEQIKAKPCMLWPMQFSDGYEVLEVCDEAFKFKCNSRRSPDSRIVSPNIIEVIERVYGEGCGAKVKQAAAKGKRRVKIAVSR